MEAREAFLEPPPLEEPPLEEQPLDEPPLEQRCPLDSGLDLEKDFFSMSSEMTMNSDFWLPCNLGLILSSKSSISDEEKLVGSFYTASRKL